MSQRQLIGDRGSDGRREMKVDYAFFASGADVSQDRRLNVFGGEIGGIGVSEFPAAPLPLCLVIRLLSPCENVGTTSSLTLRWKERGIDEDLAPPHKDTFTPDVNVLDPQADSGVLIIVQIGIQFSNAGVYECVISVDDEELRRVPLHVNLAPRPSPPVTANDSPP